MRHATLICGALASVALLALFLLLQGVAPGLLQLPSQWLWMALVPVAVALVAGGYVIRFKAGYSGIEFEGVDKKLEALPEARRPASEAPARAPEGWQNQRQDEYARTDGLFLVHVYKPSEQPDQIFDVFIYLVRHTKDSIQPIRTGFPDVKQVEFYFGAAWGHQVFTVGNTGDNILGVRARADGTFLATCRVTFNDEKKAPIVIHRYVDCELLARAGRRSRLS
jgi:hypothetical protein